MTASKPNQLSDSCQIIEASIQRLRQLSSFSVQQHWHVLAGEPDILHPLPPDLASSPAVLNSRQHIAWPKGRQCLWLYQTIQWPSHVAGFPVTGYRAKLALRWWADQAEIYLNGQLVQTGDLFDCFTRINLSPGIEPGARIHVALRLLSPEHDDGALVKSHLVFESPDESLPEPSFFADELAVLYRYLQQFDPDQLEVVTDQVASLEWPQEESCDRPVKPSDCRFLHSLVQVREQLTVFSSWIKQRHIHCLGHAHLDLAWLWPISDTWDAAERTFRSVLALQKDFPNLTYTHSSPALFAWLEENRPELFQAVQQQVKQGKWAVDAGMWVEPDLNLINGESIVRQILYGQRYCQEKFGQVSPIAWLPDTFGFNWQIPQLLVQGGINYFATQKLRWNDTNSFPHDWFWWEGLDGTRIQSLTLPLIGSDIEPINMADYACAWEANTGKYDSLWLPGVGDHGGGPTRDMLEKARRWSKSPFFPQLSFNHVVDFLVELETSSSSYQNPLFSAQYSAAKNQQDNSSQLPVWQDELYLELHRGCYTTHADQKWFNRRSEDLLYQAELFSSIATLTAKKEYPKTQIETAWKNVLFNQFHDILPGSSIPEVFIEANQLWQKTLETGNAILREALESISTYIDISSPPALGAQPLIIFNALNWPRTELIAVPIPDSLETEANWHIADFQGNLLPTQRVQESSQTSSSYPPTILEKPHLLFKAEDIPSIGYQAFWLLPTKGETSSQTQTLCHDSSSWTLENSYFRITIDPATGDLSSIYDQQQNREVLQNKGNELLAFQDSGQYWDAWNIAPDYQSHPEPNTQLISIQWLEKGPLRQRLQVTRQLGKSTFQQDYILEEHSPLFKIRTFIDWQETQVLVKTAFSHKLEAPKATCEIAFGAIERATVPQTSCEKAKWEVPTLTWIDVSQVDYGLSILTDSKHGFDAQPNCLRLSLLKAPLWPDPNADRGFHQTQFALYPHSSSWNVAQTAHHARAFNIPLYAYLPQNITQEPASNKLPSNYSFLKLSSDAGVILSALKQSEDQAEHFIVRFYEPYGQASSCEVVNMLGLQLQEAVDLIELSNPSKETVIPHENSVPVQPWQVVNLKFMFKGE